MLAVGCSRDGPPNASGEELHLTYASSGAPSNHTNNTDPPFDACALTAPGETLVLAKTSRDFEAVLYGPCETMRDFRSSHLRTDLDILRQDRSLPTTLTKTIWFPGAWGLNVNADTPAGTTVLASLKHAGESWFVTAAVVVEKTGPQVVAQQDAYTEDGRLITLASTWSELVADASTIRADYSNHCPDLPKHRKMDDQEFDEFVHASAAEPCDADVGQFEPDKSVPVDSDAGG